MGHCSPLLAARNPCGAEMNRAGVTTQGSPTSKFGKECCCHHGPVRGLTVPKFSHSGSPTSRSAPVWKNFRGFSME
ncbi:hypothetical protein JZ751_029076 [Albula glossodonta]|uniref:Uncharacterized protein n=1 Tax=Albula glossodonta TaxID=121402 RepID=A0A8T2P934_9TELE|nr:hypothetical protein JZ751_029076 [Albula glossodonta]